ncbi:ABC transporter substrate-binding protein [Natronoglomus mannanivorans]|uniref:ABC transporter substrate-binding protein n=1 Tax=Natronoglomus mannanivorans TaxID=2979990 RepID=A0AAP3E3A8_9EURY|nr:ABC transporter substrate-binding protein [Halobacteria archaeon AArc-xg1-1]
MRPNIDRRRFLLGSAAATTAFAGCLSDDDGDDTDEDPSDDTDTDETADDQLNLMQIQQQTLDPIGISGRAAGRANWQTHEQLFTYAGGTDPVEGLLAEDYSVSEDNLTYTIDLKEDVTFHDGSELTADDVVYSLRRLAESENNRGHESTIVGSTLTIAHERDDDEEIVPDSLAVDAVDDHTVEIELESPFHRTLAVLADINCSIIPEGAVGDIEGYDGEYDYDEWSTEHVHGTGPFALESWDQGNEIVLERFDDYHGDGANIDSIRWQIIEDSNAIYNRAMNENADVFELPRSQFDPDLLDVQEEIGNGRRVGEYGPVRNDRTLQYGEVTLPQTTYLLFDTLAVERPARRAIAYIVNQETIAERAYRGQATDAYHLTPPATFPGGPEEYWDRAENEYPYGYRESRLDDAREVMEDAGYDAENMYETTLHHPSDSNASEWRDIASLLRDQAESVHIDLSIEEAPSTTLTNQAIEGSLEIFATYNELEYDEADATLQYAYPNPWTWTQWGQGDEMSDAAERAAAAWEDYEGAREPGEENEAIREDVYRTLESANWEDMTQLPLVHDIRERYSYEWVENLEMVGSQHNQQFTELTLGDRS